MIVIDWTSYGERIVTARRRRKLTQAELADLIGISRNTVSEIERGATVPSYAIVMSICATLDVIEPEYQTIERGEV